MEASKYCFFNRTSLKVARKRLMLPIAPPFSIKTDRMRTLVSSGQFSKKFDAMVPFEPAEKKNLLSSEKKSENLF